MPADKVSASWQNGHAAACKAVYAGSIPALAFVNEKTEVHDCMPGWRNW